MKRGWIILLGLVIIIVLLILIYTSKIFYNHSCNTTSYFMNSTGSCESHVGCSIPESSIPDGGYCERKLNSGPNCFIPLTVGCAPVPPEMSKIGNYKVQEYESSKVNSLISSLPDNLKSKIANNESLLLTLKVIEVKKILESPDGDPVKGNYIIYSTINLENKIIQIETGHRYLNTLAGHFMEWDIKGFYPNVNDTLNINITIVTNADEIADRGGQISYEVSNQ